MLAHSEYFGKLERKGLLPGFSIPTAWCQQGTQTKCWQISFFPQEKLKIQILMGMVIDFLSIGYLSN